MQKKPLSELVQELANVAYEVEKLKYNNPQWAAGWIRGAYVLAYGLERGCGKNQLAHSLQKLIDEANQELSDLSAKVEVTN